MRILLVEDELRLARSYQRNLQDDGHSVELAPDGETAYERVMDSPNDFDVIILDVLLPGRDGVTVCRDLRSAGVTLPILLLTALDQTEDKVAGLDAGADDYLTKPFPLDELLARLRALTRRGRQFDANANATTLEVSDLSMDLLRREVIRGNRLVPLTAREFTLLEYLMRNVDRVLTRQQLWARVWPDGTEAGSNVLDTYIHYLREKIDRDTPEKLIHTARGVGYAIRTPQQADRAQRAAPPEKGGR
jgi:DNA-binding response OmpR family regulator